MDLQPFPPGGMYRPPVRSRPRIALAAGVGVALVLTLVLPNLSILSRPPDSRWLVSTTQFFLKVLPSSFGPQYAADGTVLAVGVNAAYAGLALVELGLVLGFLTFWNLALPEINRWMWVLMFLAGALLSVGSSTVILARQFIAQSGLGVTAGYAWATGLAAGLTLLIGALTSRRRIDRSWFQTRPELM